MAWNNERNSDSLLNCTSSNVLKSTMIIMDRPDINCSKRQSTNTKETSSKKATESDRGTNQSPRDSQVCSSQHHIGSKVRAMNNQQRSSRIGPDSNCSKRQSTKRSFTQKGKRIRWGARTGPAREASMVTNHITSKARMVLLSFTTCSLYSGFALLARTQEEHLKLC